MDAGPDGHAHGQVHLVSQGNHDSRDVLGRIAHDRDQNKTNECFADVRFLNNVVDAAHQVVGTNGDQDRNYDENCSGGDWAHLWAPSVLLFLGLSFRVEEIAMCAELEEKVHDVQKQENNGGASRQDQDAGLLVLLFVLTEDGVEL